MKAISETPAASWKPQAPLLYTIECLGDGERNSSSRPASTLFITTVLRNHLIIFRQPQLAFHLGGSDTATFPLMASLREKYQIVRNNGLGPDMKRHSSYPKSDLPQFLFRAYSDKSMGTNEPDRFECEYRKMGYGCGLFSQQQRHTLKAEIRDHTKESKTRRSSFISFSASLLTTLQRAVWHKEKRYSNIYVAVFDTHFLGEQDIILPTSILLGAFNILEKRQYINLDCAEENLVCGSR
jgi:hypothetical protein